MVKEELATGATSTRVLGIFLWSILASILACSSNELDGVDVSVLPEKVAILSYTEAARAFFPCSRTGPIGVASSSLPTTSEVLSAEERLRTFVTNKLGRSVDDFYRQYAALNIDGKRVLYVNAFYTHGFAIEQFSPNWRIKYVDICDGSDAFWGVEYHLDKQTFLNLETNPGPRRRD
jgi:hypothetical protein